MFCYKCFSVVCFDAFVGFVDVYALWLYMLTIHCGRRPQNNRDLPVATISRLSNLPRKFRRFAEHFGKFWIRHEVDRDRWKIFGKYAVCLPKNIQSLKLSVMLEMYAMLNWSKTTELGLFGKVWVLYVYNWIISAWDSRGNEWEVATQPTVSKITYGYWLSFDFLTGLSQIKI